MRERPAKTNMTEDELKALYNRGVSVVVLAQLTCHHVQEMEEIVKGWTEEKQRHLDAIKRSREAATQTKNYMSITGVKSKEKVEETEEVTILHWDNVKKPSKQVVKRKVVKEVEKKPIEMEIGHHSDAYIQKRNPPEPDIYKAQSVQPSGGQKQIDLIEQKTRERFDQALRKEKEEYDKKVAEQKKREQEQKEEDKATELDMSYEQAVAVMEQTTKKVTQINQESEKKKVEQRVTQQKPIEKEQVVQKVSESKPVEIKPNRVTGKGVKHEEIPLLKTPKFKGLLVQLRESYIENKKPQFAGIVMGEIEPLTYPAVKNKGEKVNE